ncbi:MAG: RHS repeat-associated core domain-containing protein [Caldilineaceae bacterium]
MLSTDTDPNAVADVRQGYCAYGRYRSGGALPTDHKFTGQKIDAATGLYYYGARYYDRDIGAFISPDTIVPEPGLVLDYNRYVYARGNALRYNDPTGHDACGPGENPYRDEYLQGLSTSDCAEMSCNISYELFLAAKQQYVLYALNPDSYYYDVAITTGAIEGTGEEDIEAVSTNTALAYLYSSYFLNLDINVVLERESNGLGPVCTEHGRRRCLWKIVT